ncbi:hypothetical protein M885DRAFT_519791 [Pelagophyceae sp. CCMP2097]|nr:hypothetical protein M885DRAFT_519791 [Pelagophyceae sp. CCMP2097]
MFLEYAPQYFEYLSKTLFHGPRSVKAATTARGSGSPMPIPLLPRKGTRPARRAPTHPARRLAGTLAGGQIRKKVASRSPSRRAVSTAGPSMGPRDAFSQPLEAVYCAGPSMVSLGRSLFDEFS